MLSRPAPSPSGRPRVRKDFVGKTLSGVSESLEHAVFDQDMALAPGFLQGADPRAKLICALALLLAVGLSRHPIMLALTAALTIVLAAATGLSAPAFAKRSWLGIPVFALIVALPSLFLVPGREPLPIVAGLPFRIAITDAGLAGALTFVLRVGASVSIAVLLVSTTRWAGLLRSLRVLGVPESLVVVLGMTYRYLFLLLHSANALFLARASRTVGVSAGAEERRWAAAAAGTLVSKSMKMSGDVLLAMRARGFAGEVRTALDPGMRDEDWLLLSAGIAFAATLLLLDVRLP